MSGRAHTDADCSRATRRVGARSSRPRIEPSTENPAPESGARRAKLNRLSWLGTSGGVSVVAAAVAILGAGISGYVAISINSDELSFQRSADQAEREHERAVALEAARVEAIKQVTEAANTYVQRQTERIPACVVKDSASCRRAARTALDAQFKLRSAAETARGALSGHGLQQLEAIESFFANLYARNRTGVPPDEPVDTEGLHEALVVFSGLSTEPVPQP